ncbi:hypothetical protein [Paraliomyxa miuraensis]|uniref:hypothetical protein n=1 Tax=Paraliomyxa miuraensis TaxID=376150 RepID=UPI00224EF8A1|nr:hypothetical protein [Paraliomyxa miuraensis]
MARSPVAIFEARRKVVDDELSSLTQEQENIEQLMRQLLRRRELLEGRWELLIAERDLLDERIWQGQAPQSVGPRPPVIPRGRSSQGPRDLAPEPWDFEGIELAS